MSYYGVYRSAFETRYTGEKTSKIFSPDNRYKTWRWLWVLLAKGEKKCGLSITDKQIDQMYKHMKDIPYARVQEIEKETRHDVVAHIRAYAEQCPDAAPIIHLGATSCYVTDNTDVILIHDAVDAVRPKLSKLVNELAGKAWLFDHVPTLGRTHFQPAQPVTIGKRYAMWSQDFSIDLENLIHQEQGLKLLGCRGATGTADSFLQLFEGDADKVRALEDYIVNQIGIGRAFPVSGQTYTRKQDYYVLQVLSGIAQSATKFATDIRLLAGLGEVSEPFGSEQVGSSAMPYKQNPIMCEKICGLSRYVITGVQNAAMTASSQWLERTLDDSSNRRVVIPEMFIATEVILDTCLEVVQGLEWHTETSANNYILHQDNAMVEGVLAESVKRGGDRQKLHEKLRKYITSKEGVLAVKIAEDPDFHLTLDEVQDIRSRISTGLAPKQAAEYAGRFIL